MTAALLLAALARWLTTKAFKGIELDHWLRRSGIAATLGASGRVPAARLAAQTVYWGILVAGVLTALNAFGTELTGRMTSAAVLLLPRLLGAAAILVGGMWLAQYLGRSALVWAVNEDLPSPRKLALLVRAAVLFAAVVVTADFLNFAPAVFLAAFVILLAGAALAGGLAVGLGARDAVRHHLELRQETHDERSLWTHL